LIKMNFISITLSLAVEVEVWRQQGELQDTVQKWL